MSSYRLSRPAKADLDAIWLHIADDIEQGVRVFPVESYLIYYRIHRGGISIARVIHGMRDQEGAWKEE